MFAKEDLKMKQVKTKAGFWLKNVKHFPGMEGEAVDCDIYRNDTKVCHFHDDGTGGEAIIDYCDGVDKKEIERTAFEEVDRLKPEDVNEFPEDIRKSCAISSLENELEEAEKNYRACVAMEKRGYPYIVSGVWQGFSVKTLAMSLNSKAVVLKGKHAIAMMFGVKPDDKDLVFSVYSASSFASF